MGFEPTRAEPIGLAVQRLNHSATSSGWLSRRFGMVWGSSQPLSWEKMRRPGIEPGSTAWKAAMLTIIPPSSSAPEKIGLNRDLNPGPLAPKARIIPLDH